MKNDNKHSVGVIVGRFQVHELNDAHRELIARVCNKHDKTIIFLGLSPLMVTIENPLDFEARKQMILEAFSNVTVLYIKDVNNDEVWSQKLDEMIDDVTTPAQAPILYGGRDSFINRYTGKYPTEELEPESYIKYSGTEIRRNIALNSTKSSPEFRAGVVWASQSRFPICYPTVDVAIFNEDYSKILLGRKPSENNYRLIGGFADPASSSYEADARREVREEAGIEITDPQYIRSFQIDDWRYRGEIDKIKTLLFGAKIFSGAPRPNDDIVEIRWFDVMVFPYELVVDNHRDMIEEALAWAEATQEDCIYGHRFPDSS